MFIYVTYEQRKNFGKSWKDAIPNRYATRILATFWRKNPCGAMVLIKSYAKPRKTYKKTRNYLLRTIPTLQKYKNAKPLVLLHL